MLTKLSLGKDKNEMEKGEGGEEIRRGQWSQLPRSCSLVNNVDLGPRTTSLKKHVLPANEAYVPRKPLTDVCQEFNSTINLISQRSRRLEVKKKTPQRMRTRIHTP